jgi:hypothetical protein
MDTHTRKACEGCGESHLSCAKPCTMMIRETDRYAPIDQVTTYRCLRCGLIAHDNYLHDQNCLTLIDLMQQLGVRVPEPRINADLLKKICGGETFSARNQK